MDSKIRALYENKKYYKLTQQEGSDILNAKVHREFRQQFKRTSAGSIYSNPTTIKTEHYFAHPELMNLISEMDNVDGDRFEVVSKIDFDQVSFDESWIKNDHWEEQVVEDSNLAYKSNEK